MAAPTRAPPLRHTRRRRHQQRNLLPCAACRDVRRKQLHQRRLLHCCRRSTAQHALRIKPFWRLVAPRTYRCCRCHAQYCRRCMQCRRCCARCHRCCALYRQCCALRRRRFHVELSFQQAADVLTHKGGHRVGVLGCRAGSAPSQVLQDAGLAVVDRCRDMACRHLRHSAVDRPPDTRADAGSLHQVQIPVQVFVADAQEGVAGRLPQRWHV
mmetsp:Transcript_32682/g.97486  ORF Transcript_32682/g.97486 Transcript_32682/m.97486 type:complete len:212 (-) Transcript_32682:710-1345(-)